MVCLRRLDPPAGGSSHLYLTFDDGPDPRTTPEVLRILAGHKMTATFFLIVKQAKAFPGLVHHIKNAGHGIGNHSLDHRWSPYFRPRSAMLDWVRESEVELSRLIGTRSVGFRPPAGVMTPPLMAALAAFQLPLFHWSVRFYDAVFAFRRQAAARSLSLCQSGDIVLLHDRQKEKNRRQFLDTLDFYLTTLQQNGWSSSALPYL